MATQETTALVSLAPTFVVSVDEIKARIEELQAFVRGYMVAGEDYGTIPGTQKPTLYKPGAEKLCDVYGFTKEFLIVASLEEWERGGRFAYTIKCILRSKRTGLLEAEGLGSCNSMEAKYRWIWVWEDKLPSHLDKTNLVSKRTKKGTVQYRVPNDDPYSQVNTILKMAKKRALVDAVLSATRSSGLFMQDLEDLKANGVLGDDEGIETPYVLKPSAGGPAPSRSVPTDDEKQLMRLYAHLLKEGVGADELNEVIATETAGKKRNAWNPEEWQAAIARLDAMRTALAPLA